MNFALPAVLIFLLVLPGILVKYAYARGLSKLGDSGKLRPITDEIAYSIIFALAIHMFFILVIYYILSIRVKIDAVLMLLIGSFGKDNKYFEYCVQSVTDSPFEIGIYFLIVNGFSVLIGNCAHEFVRKHRWDLKYRFFRFRDEWAYLLTGEVNCYADYTKGISKKPDMVAISGVIDFHDKSYLYVGRVIDFYFDKEGDLDRILITDAQRRELSQDKESNASPQKLKKRFYPIDGDYFVLKYPEVKNLNIKYMYYQKVEKISNG